MKGPTLLALLVLELVLVGPGAERPALAQPGPGRRSGAAASPAERQASIARTVQTAIGPWMEQNKPPGAMVVVRERGVTHFFPFGYADRAKEKTLSADSVFELASITKVVCATSLAMEVDAGRMRLDDHVVKYAPPLDTQGADIRRVTLEELATHTSSLPRTPGKPPGGPGGQWNTELLMKWLVTWKAPYPPGTRSLYSNFGFGLLGQAIANHEHAPLIDVWRRQFLGPLGMDSTYFELPANRAHQLVQGYSPQGKPVAPAFAGGWPAGGRLKSSGRDMSSFLAANLGERPDLPKITQAMRLAHKPFFQASPKMTQGLAWQRLHLEGMLCIDKNGGLAGTSTYIGMLPGQNLGVVVLTNRGKCKATAVGRKLLMALAGKQHTDAPLNEADEPDDEP